MFSPEIGFGGLPALPPCHVANAGVASARVLVREGNHPACKKLSEAKALKVGETRSVPLRARGETP